MIRTSTIAMAAALVALAACSPQKTPEQIQAEKNAAALQQMGAAFGAMAEGRSELTPEQLSAAIAKAGAMASTMDANMTPEERAKLQAITGAMASGQVDPAAAAWLAGANKAFDLLGSVKTVADVNAITPQVTAVYAEMTAPAATLKAMPEDKRDVAFGSAMPQMIGMSTKAMSVLSRLSYDNETMEAVGKLLDKMPQMD
ncbi:MAG: hypothetical protein ABMA14_04200 [Hyphomonadaceae bacterium]